MRAAALQYVEVSTGTVLDTVRLADGELRFDTGSAEPMFASRRDRLGWSAETAYDELTGWSNGYAALRPVEP